MQKHLPLKSDLTLKWELEIAQSQETTAQNKLMLLPSMWRVSLFPIGRWGATAVEEGTTCPIGSAVSSTQNAIITVVKDTLPEAAAQKELRTMPRHWKNQGTGESGPEPSGYKLTENQTVRKIAWRIHGVQDQRQRSLTHYSAAAYQWKFIDHGS